MNVDHVRIGDIAHRVQRAEEVVVDRIYPNAGVLNRGRGLFTKDAIAGSATAAKHLFRLAAGDIVYSKLFAWEGSVAVVDEERAGKYVSSEFPTFTPDSTRVDVGYLRHALGWSGFLDQVASMGSGLGQRRQRVNPDRFVTATIPLPSLADQRRIAAHLDAVASQATSMSTRAAVADRAVSVDDLPRLMGDVLRAASLPLSDIADLATVANDTVHPGDPLDGADEFIGLEHIARHTGGRVGLRPVGNESGRKFRFRPGDVTYGYLRPYLNKAWSADRAGLCSVEQFVLRPSPGVESTLLSTLLRSDIVLTAVNEATNNLQLPRLRQGTLMALPVPDIRRAGPDVVSRIERRTHLIVELERHRARRRTALEALLPAARNEVFSALR